MCSDKVNCTIRFSNRSFKSLQSQFKAKYKEELYVNLTADAIYLFDDWSDGVTPSKLNEKDTW